MKINWLAVGGALGALGAIITSAVNGDIVTAVGVLGAALTSSGAFKNASS